MKKTHAFGLRLPEDLKYWLKNLARDTRSTVSHQIERILREEKARQEGWK